MIQFQDSNLNTTESPWGYIQHKRRIASGLWSVSTAGHGGFWLSAERWNVFRHLLPTFEPYAATQWLEEDCDVCAAAIVWPEAFAEDGRFIAGCVEMVRGCWGRQDHPELLAFLESPAGQPARDQAQAWVNANGGNWQTGSMSCGAHSDGWCVSMIRVSDGKEQTRTFADYPKRGVYTDEELDQESKPYVRPDQPAPAPGTLASLDPANV